MEKERDPITSFNTLKVDKTKAARKFEEIMSRQEKLLPVLKPYLNQAGSFPVLRHPYVFGVPYTPAMNAYYNEQYKQKLEMLKRAKQEKNWGSYIFLHERPYRIEALIDKKDEMTDAEYWEMLGTVWSDSENLWQMNPFLPWLLKAKRPEKEKMMDEDEREMLESLPNEFLIYRGHQKRNRSGYSWTLSYMTAKWFAGRFQQKEAAVVSALCKKENVHAVMLGRSEFEIVVSPENLTMKPVRKLSRPGIFQILFDEAWARYALKARKSYHGRWHWEKVERNVLTLCKQVKADKVICRLFAILHDSKRENEDDDPKHGHRAADWISKDKLLKKSLSTEQMDKLMFACRHHNDGQVSDDPTVGVCWDADRLDLPRVGIVPDPELLSTDVAKSLIWRI